MNADVGFAIILLTPDDRCKKIDEFKYKKCQKKYSKIYYLLEDDRQVEKDVQE